jgi:hypothetical protein
LCWRDASGVAGARNACRALRPTDRGVGEQH